MNDELAAIIDRNTRRKPGTTWLEVPKIPTLGMMIAAADKANVFVEGDTVASWFELIEDDHGPEETWLDAGLVERFGRQRAFVLTSLADAWSGALDGLDEWITVRGRRGSDAFADNWLKGLPVGYPSGGWPKSKDSCTDAQKLHTRLRTPAFAVENWPYGLGDHSMIAPVSCAAIMGLRGSQAKLSSTCFTSFLDHVEGYKIPYIPGFSVESRWDEDERPHLLVAAAWSAAVEWLLDDDRTDSESFPFHPDNQAIRLTDILESLPGIHEQIPDLFFKAPFASAEITAPTCYVKVSAKDGLTTFEYGDAEGPVSMHRGFVAGSNMDDHGLGEYLATVASNDDAEFKLVSLRKESV